MGRPAGVGGWFWLTPISFTFLVRATGRRKGEGEGDGGEQDRPRDPCGLPYSARTRTAGIGAGGRGGKRAARGRDSRSGESGGPQRPGADLRSAGRKSRGPQRSAGVAAAEAFGRGLAGACAPRSGGP